MSDWLNLGDLEPGQRVLYVGSFEGTYPAKVISVQRETAVIEFADGQVKAVLASHCIPEKP